MARIRDRGSRAGALRPRVQTASHASAPVSIQWSALSGLVDSRRGVSAATHDVIGRLSAATNALNERRLAERFEDAKQQGSAARDAEVMAGTPVQTEDTLKQQLPGYRQGYLLSEGANQVADAGRELRRKVAEMEPLADPTPVIQETLAPLLQEGSFRDPEVRKRLLPAVESLRQSALDQYAKTETAELLERQQENVATLIRSALMDRSLASQEGFDKLAGQLDSPEFAFIHGDEYANSFSEQLADLVEKGEFAPDDATQLLQSVKSADGVPLWDRKDEGGRRWADHFTNAVKAGGAVRQRAAEAQQAEAQAAKEHEWVGLAYRGGFSPMKIDREADSLGLTGSDRLAFVRRWESQNHAGLERLRREAEEAERHRKTLEAMQMGNHLQHTNAQLQKAASEEWAKAMASGDSKARGRVIAQFTRAGVEIPQLRDLFRRVTSHNIPHLADLYDNLRKVDPVVADRYLDDGTAAILTTYLRDVVEGGYSHQEAIQNLPLGMKKVERAEASRVVSDAWDRFTKDRAETLKDGIERPAWLDWETRRRATNIIADNPYITPAVALQTAERMEVSGRAVINGVLVQPGIMKRGAEPQVSQHVMDVEKELGDHVPELFKGKLYASPDKYSGGLFRLRYSGGSPVLHPETGDFIEFDPNEVAARRRQYDAEKAAHELKASNAETLRRGVTFMGKSVDEAARTRLSKGSDPSTWIQTERGSVAPDTPEGRRASNPFPDFATWASSRK